MYAVRCPKCKQLLKLPNPVQQARLRCNACKTVFVGSTEVLPDPQTQVARPPRGSAAARRMERRRPSGGEDGARGPHGHVPRRRPVNLTIPILVVMATILVTVVVIWIVHYLVTHPVVEIKDARGNVVERRRVTQEQRQRILEEQARQQEQQAAEAAAKQAAAIAAARGPGGGAPGPQIPPPPPRDSSVEVLASYTPGAEDAMGRGLLRGSVVNEGDDVVVSTDVTVVFYSPDGAAVDMVRQTVRCLPTKVPVPFAIAYSKPLDVPYARGEIYAADVRRRSELVAQEIQPNEILRDPPPADGIKVLKGKTTNRTGFALRNVEIVCDFYDTQGALLDTAIGQVDGGPNVSVDGPMSFTIRLDTRSKNYLPETIRTYALRFCGQKASPP